MIKERAMELVGALRSGRYQQTRNRLRTDSGYCCLGVACAISGLNEWKLTDRLEWTYLEEDNILPERVIEHFGFYNRAGEPRISSGHWSHGDMEIGGKRFHCLAEANDGGATFEQIADFIEKNWENL